MSVLHSIQQGESGLQRNGHSAVRAFGVHDTRAGVRSSSRQDALPRDELCDEDALGKHKRGMIAGGVWAGAQVAERAERRKGRVHERSSLGRPAYRRLLDGGHGRWRGSSRTALRPAASPRSRAGHHPRKRRGRRYALAGLLAVGIAAVIAVTRSFAVVGQWAAGPARRCWPHSALCRVPAVRPWPKMSTARVKRNFSEGSNHFARRPVS